MITSEPFATQDQVLGYFNSNSQEITRKIPLGTIHDIVVSNYYLVVEDGKEPIIVLVNSKTEFYVSVTKVLTKKTGHDVFSKILSPSKQNINNSVLENKILSGSLQLKHLESDPRIKIAMRPTSVQTIAPTPILHLDIDQTIPMGLRGQTGPTGLSGLANPASLRRVTGPTGPALIQPFEGGHMLDYIRYQEQTITRRIGQTTQVQNQTTTQTVTQPSSVEEIQDDASYKDNVTCKICLSNKINIVCIPCGHCFCSACNTQSRNNLCAVCRSPITKAQALFI